MSMPVTKMCGLCSEGIGRYECLVKFASVPTSIFTKLIRMHAIQVQVKESESMKMVQ